jgi:hypothetical protein
MPRPASKGAAPGQRFTSIIVAAIAASLVSLAVQTRADGRSSYITLQVSLLSLVVLPLRSALRPSRHAVTRYLVVGSEKACQGLLNGASHWNQHVYGMHAVLAMPILSPELVR